MPGDGVVFTRHYPVLHAGECKAHHAEKLVFVNVPDESVSKCPAEQIGLFAATNNTGTELCGL